MGAPLIAPARSQMLENKFSQTIVPSSSASQKESILLPKADTHNEPWMKFLRSGKEGTYGDMGKTTAEMANEAAEYKKGASLKVPAEPSLTPM